MDARMKVANELKKEIRRALGGYPKVTKVEVLGLENEGLMIAVRYHTTDVVKLYLNKAGYAVMSVVVNSGGWITKTTADRINAVLFHLRTGFAVRFTYKRDSSVRGVYGIPRQMGDTLHDQKFTLTSMWTAGDDPKGTGKTGMLRTEMPFEDGMTFKRRGKEFVLTTPNKAKQKKTSKVVFTER